MHELEKGVVVRSRAGRDKDQFFVVLESMPTCCLIADGKQRPLERPKKKNRRHLCYTDHRLELSAIFGNRALHRTLREMFEQRATGGNQLVKK